MDRPLTPHPTPRRAPQSHKLERSLGLMDATAMVAGIIIGASVFVQPSEVLRHVPSARGVAAVWLAAGFLTLCGALVCAELSTHFPETGGMYVYLRETISPGAGFLWGWAMFWSAHSGIIAAIAVVLARYVGYFFPLNDRGLRLVAIAAILLLSSINYLGAKPGARVQLTLTIVKVAAIVVLVVAMYFFAPAAVASVSAPQPVSSPSVADFLLAVSAGLFTYGGWHMATYAAGETKAAERTIPRALLGGVAIVTICYLSLNAAYLRVLPVDRALSSTRIAADAAAVIAGSRSASIISGLVVLSALGSLNGIVLAGPRVYYAMAQDGLWFRWMGAVHSRFQTPHWAIAAQALWSVALVATGTYRALFTRVIYTEWLFFGLMTIGLLRLRRSRGVRRSPIIPVIFLISCAAIALNQLASDPVNGAIGLAFVAAGAPLYYFWIRRRRPIEESSYGH